MRPLNREILRLSIPSILANLTVPLVGMVDTAVAGHLPASGGFSAASFIGAISLGAVLFNLIYWNFGFLRTGTGGLTAQAFGRGDTHGSAKIFYRAIALALIISVVTIALQTPLLKLALLIVGGSPEAEFLASQYFRIRIWAAPATLSLMAFSGWFVGMQDSMSSMWKDLVVNAVNIIASVLLSLGFGSWKGLGFKGVALGTVIAQYSGLLFCTLVCALKYRKKVFAGFRLGELKGVLGASQLSGFFKMNLDLLGRSLGFTAIYVGYTLIAARLGDMMLACSAIMMQLLMIFSYFTDGFAYAGEALVGRFIGAGDRGTTRSTVRWVFVWSMSISVLFIGIYALAGVPLLRLLTSDGAVVETCRVFLPWLMLMPPLGCAAFTWDGVYLGATASRGICLAMLLAAVAFFAVWSLGSAFWEGLNGIPAIHLLLGAYFAHLLARTVYLSLAYRRSILIRPFDIIQQ